MRVWYLRELPTISGVDVAEGLKESGTLRRTFRGIVVKNFREELKERVGN